MSISRIVHFCSNAASVFPVVGPHAGIEAQLLLSGIKPVGSFSVFTDDYLLRAGQNSSLPALNDLPELSALDEAVERGELIVRKVEFAANPDLALRYYAQPDQKKNLDFFLLFEAESRTRELDGVNLSGDPTFKRFFEENPSFDPPKSFGELYGYRKRDNWFFEKIINNKNLPERLKAAILYLSRYSLTSYQNTLLSSLKGETSPNPMRNTVSYRKLPSINR